VRRRARASEKLFGELLVLDAVVLARACAQLVREGDLKAMDIPRNRARLRDVKVDALVVAVALEVLALDEALDALLDVLRIRRKAADELLRHLGDEVAAYRGGRARGGGRARRG
jgi:hypothetical protein